MEPYIDKSFNEDGKPEYSIHGLDERLLCDIIVAGNLLRHMLKGKLKLKSFNGPDLNHNPEHRETALLNLILHIAEVLKQKNPEQ